LSQAAARVVAAIRTGEPVVLPTDTVYGLCVSPYSERHAQRLYRLKGRDEREPVALLAGDLDTLLDDVPELRGRAASIARGLLPGPWTLVLPNPARRFRWLTGGRPETIGVRVPELPDEARDVLAEVGALAATSANLTGGPDPSRLEDVPREILERCGAVLDGGALPGLPSTVLDLTGEEPAVLRAGAGSAADALERVRGLIASLGSPQS